MNVLFSYFVAIISYRFIVWPYVIVYANYSQTPLVIHSWQRDLKPLFSGRPVFRFYVQKWVNSHPLFQYYPSTLQYLTHS